MTIIRQVFGSSVGLKFVMGVTGLALVGFVIVHMIGNLLVFAGPDAINAYGAALKSKPALLWTARGGLLAIFLLHVGCAAKLSRSNHEARPIAYRCPKTVQASVASRTMLLTGILLFVYIAYHLAHFTLFLVDDSFATLAHDADGRHHVYNMVVGGFQRSWTASILYVAAQVALCFHLSHGVSSVFQSLGLREGRFTKPLVRAGYVVAGIVTAGNVAIVLAARFGALTVQEIVEKTQ